MKNKKQVAITYILSAMVIVSVAMLAFNVLKFVNPSLKKFAVSKVEIVLNNNTLNDYNAEVYGESVAFGVKINDGEDLSGFAVPKISWSFEGFDLGCTLSQTGTFTPSDTLGRTTICVSVESENEVTTKIPVEITKKAGTELSNIYAVSNESVSQKYIEGQTFNKDSVTVKGMFGNYDARILDFEVEEKPLKTTDLEVSITYGTYSCEVPILVASKSLQSIEVLSAPKTTNYIEGQTFNKDGLKIKANYEFLNEIVDDFYVDETTKLEFGKSSVDIEYTFNGITKSVKQNISVSHRELESISLTDNGINKEYTQGDIFDATGLVVTANFKVVASEEVSNFSYSKLPLKGSDNFIEISYTENGITKTAFINDIKVEKPYSKIRRIKLLPDCKNNVSMRWLYTYVTDEGEPKTDNTAYAEHNNLLCDEEGGNFDVPVGAKVMLTITNNIINDFLFDGNKQNLKYPIGSYSFVLKSGDELEINAEIIYANRISVRFEGDGKSKSFNLTNPWNKPLTEQYLNELFLVFADTDNYYYTYSIESTDYTFEELKAVEFVSDTLVSVTKNNKVVPSQTLTLHYYDELSLEIELKDKDISLENLTYPERAGFDFVGWAVSQDGTAIDEAGLKNYLAENQTEFHLFAIWDPQAPDYSSEEFIGTWKVTYENIADSDEMVSENVIMTIVLNSDGTFSYSVELNGTPNNAFTGKFRLEEEKIVVIDADATMDTINIAPSKFVLNYSNGELKAVIFIIDSNNELIEIGISDQPKAMEKIA